MPKVLAVDVARYGDDRSVIGLRQGRKFEIKAKLAKLDTVQVTERVIEVIDSDEPDAVVVDGDGLGAGVVDQLKHRAAHGSGPQKLFVSAPEFISQAPEKIDWLIEGVIERGANGFFSAVPKGGKSWAAVDLALSLALGCDWLGFRIPHPVRVALISREDNPTRTASRMKQLFAANSCAVPGLI